MRNAGTHHGSRRIRRRSRQFRRRRQRLDPRPRIDLNGRLRRRSDSRQHGRVVRAAGWRRKIGQPRQRSLHRSSRWWRRQWSRRWNGRFGRRIGGIDHARQTTDRHGPDFDRLTGEGLGCAVLLDDLRRLLAEFALGRRSGLRAETRGHAAFEGRQEEIDGAGLARDLLLQSRLQTWRVVEEARPIRPQEVPQGRGEFSG